jgi:hypothetical protein
VAISPALLGSLLLSTKATLKRKVAAERSKPAQRNKCKCPVGYRRKPQGDFHSVNQVGQDAWERLTLAQQPPQNAQPVLFTPLRQAKAATVPSTIAAVARAAQVAFGSQLEKANTKAVGDPPHRLNAIEAAGRWHGRALLKNWSVIYALHDIQRS